jgi:hypothetical protein
MFYSTCIKIGINLKQVNYLFLVIKIVNNKKNRLANFDPK